MALNMLNTYINFPGEKLALNLFVYNKASSTPANTVDSCGVHGDICGALLLNRAHSLDVCNTAFLVESHVCGQRNNFMFSKWLR